MGRARIAVVGVVVALLVVFTASAALSAVPRFKSPARVTTKVEAYLNGRTHKALLAKARMQVTGHIACEYLDYGAARTGQVQCIGRLKAPSQTNGKLVGVDARWTLEKMTVSRARLERTLTGIGVFDSDLKLVRPRQFGLSAF